MNITKEFASRRSMLYKVFVGLLHLILILICSHSHSQALSVLPSWTPPNDIGVEIYELTASGASTGALFSPDNHNIMNHGCTAFCNNLPDPYCPAVGDPARGSRTYPYSDSVVTISFEHDYLLDVVPQETSSGLFRQVVLNAQAIAARSYAEY